ncbi:hypothetical protein APHAL10511_008298 [Amanita phalloides]|nr:hypothetical protein APHAL10511_008298 [Amanita phalloides]
MSKRRESHGAKTKRRARTGFRLVAGIAVSVVAVVIAYLVSGEASIFKVVDLPGKGKGLVATRDIKQGELLIREKPLFLVPSQLSSSPTQFIWEKVQSLIPADRAAYMALSYVHLPKGADPQKQPEEVALAIFQTNAVSAGEGVGIFPRMARLNHGCAGSFNSVYSWREDEGVLVVHALKNISMGQELLTTYMNTKQPRTQRRAYLAEHYGFECSCSVCSLPEEESRASDERLTAMTSLYARLASWENGKIGGREAGETAREIWRVGEEEGYWSERGRLAGDMAWVAAAHSDYDAVQGWANVAAQWYTYELGADSSQARDMAEIAQAPHKHTARRSRTKETLKPALT